MFVSSTLLLLAPSVAWGKNETSIESIEIAHEGLTYLGRVVAADPGATTTAISADITSDSGSETVDLTESDAWLHGAAAIKALPTVDADLTLTLYDTGSASLVTFSGTLGADGTVSISDVATESSTVCESKLGCPEIEEALDIEVLAAELFTNPAGGYDLALDLNGADLYSVAYADVRIDEGSSITTCDKRGCTTTTTITTTKAEVDFDDVGAVWEGELSLEPEGAIDVDVTSYDVDGKKLDKSSVTLGRLLHTVEDSYASGHTMLSAGDGGSVALLSGGGPRLATKLKDKIAAGDVLTVVSDGWTVTTAPTHASVELDGGETLTIPANSYQRDGYLKIEFEAIVITHLSLTINGGNLTINNSAQLTLSDFASPVCVDGTCVMLVENEKGTLDLSATGYADTPAGVASSVKIGVVGYDKSGAKVSSADASVEFDSEVGVVFANEVSFSGDPLGVDLSGEASLLGAADAKGKQKTLSKGDFNGGFTRAKNGDLTLSAVDKNDVQAKGDILIGGEPIDFEKTDTNGDGVIEAPPVVFYKNGTGTRNTATNTSQSQQAQLL